MKLQFTFLMLFVSITLFSQNPTNGLYAYYSFDGTLMDLSINQNHLNEDVGTIQFHSVLNSTPIDSSAFFNSNNRLYSTNTFDNSTFTATAISFWFKTITTSGITQTIIQGAYAGFGIYLDSGSGTINGFYDGSSAGSIQSSMALNDGNWHNIILQSNGSITSLYVDGKFDGSINETMYTPTSGVNTPRLFLGSTNLNLNPFYGDLNEVRIYNRTLNQSEITTLSTQPVSTNVSKFKKERINIFPNPVNNTINIVSEANSNYAYVIYDSIGQEIISGNGSMINVEILNSGVYYIRINNSITKSFIKI